MRAEPGTRRFVGKLSGREIAGPDVNRPPMPELAPPGVIHDGKPAAGFGAVDASRGYPDARSFRLKLGLIVPATNTSMEHDLWSLVLRNPALRGVGLHTANVVTPRPQLGTAEQLEAYKAQFLGGLRGALETVSLAQPEYLILGMSLEHILRGLEAVRAPMRELEAAAPFAWATWHEAIPLALRRLGAQRIGMLTPFDATGNENARRLFEDLGFEVVSSVGFSCANALHIAHVPDWAKEKAIVELLARPEHRLDAVVQCGTNMSLVDVIEKLEPMLGIPILGINAVLLWYALRENGIATALSGGGRLLREH